MNLTEQQRTKMSDISADIAQVFLASVALPYFLDTYRPVLALFGVALAVLFWDISLQFIKPKP